MKSQTGELVVCNGESSRTMEIIDCSSIGRSSNDSNRLVESTGNETQLIVLVDQHSNILDHRTTALYLSSKPCALRSTFDRSFVLDRTSSTMHSDPGSDFPRKVDHAKDTILRSDNDCCPIR